MISVPQNNKEQELIYKHANGRDLSLFFFPPTNGATENAPLLILFPGGGWMVSKALDMYRMARGAAELLQQHGFAVASVSYRNRGTDNATMDEVLADVFDAAAYLAHHADVLQVDPHRFFTGGHSAGGHLALMLAYAPCDFLADCRDYTDAFTVRASIPLSPVCDVPVLDAAFAATSKNPPQCSPLWWAERGHGVPTLFCVGDTDSLVPYEHHSLPTHQALLSHGIKSDVAISKNGGHCFEGMNGSPSNPDGVAMICYSGEHLLSLYENFI